MGNHIAGEVGRSLAAEEGTVPEEGWMRRVSEYSMLVCDAHEWLAGRSCLPVGLLRVLRTAVVVALAGHCVRCAYAIGSGWVVLLGCARSVAVGWLG